MNKYILYMSYTYNIIYPSVIFSLSRWVDGAIIIDLCINQQNLKVSNI